MPIKQIIGSITVILAFISYIPYIKDTLSGKTKPHAFSWLIWFMLTTIGFSIQIANGAGPGAWFNGVMIVVSGVIMVLGFMKGRKEIVFADWISLFLAIIAIYYWLVAKDETLSLILVISADALGLVPTLRKSFVHPHSETLATYAINAFRITLAVFAIEKFSFLTSAYHFYMIAANVLLVFILVSRRRFASESKNG